MMYTGDLLLAGMLAAALTLRAAADAAETSANLDAAAAHRRGETRVHLGALLGPSDVAALARLSDALESHTVWRHELTEPDLIAARHARAAARRATGQIRETLLSLAASADRSALAFLVDYSLAAGDWERAAGVRMRVPALERRNHTD